jgi:hypothetical protein
VSPETGLFNSAWKYRGVTVFVTLCTGFKLFLGSRFGLLCFPVFPLFD